MNARTALPLLVALIGSTTACGANSNSAASGGGGDEGISQAQCEAAMAWAPGVAYGVGAVVAYGGSTYVCVQAHTSEPGATPDTTPALWALAQCTSSAGNGSSGSGSSSGASGSGSGGSSGGSGGSSGSGSGGHGGSSGSSSGSSSSGGGSGSSSGGGGGPSASFVFSPYKDTSINMNWNTNVISTDASGSATTLASDLGANGGKAITLAFATGECGSENWAGVAGDALASANVSLLTGAGVKYVISTGGAAGSFTCGSDSGFATFVGRWMSSNLVGVDFDIEAGQSQQVIQDLISRIQTAHGTWPSLRFSLTLATLANNNGASTAQSLGSGAQDSFNTYGDETVNAVKSVLGFNGSASSWPSYLTVDLMTMDYGSASDGVCVVSGGSCQMGQSAIQAAYNLHDVWGVPYSNIELTPMIGGNDVSSEQFTLNDADTISAFAKSQGLAGIHYWSYDRDVDCAQGSASATCNSMGSGYAGAHGYLKRFLSNGL